MFPYLTGQAPWFAFLIHPRSARDVLRAPPLRVLRAYCATEAEFLAKACTLPPVVAGDIQFGFAPYRGELVSVMVMPDRLMQAEGQRAVVEAAQLAADRGARVVGLGGLTAPATGAGVRLLEHLPARVALTNGNAYTAVVVRDNVLDAARASDAPTPRVAVVGCTGSVGVAASQLLADCGLDLILIGRRAERARSLLGGLADRAVFSGSISSAAEANIIVALTSDPTARLTPEIVSPGSIVIDLAQPPNVEPALREAFAARDVAVVEGGVVCIPGYSCTFEYEMSAPGGAYACLAETYLFAREGLRDHSVGRASVQLARVLERAARKHGVRPRPLDIRPRQTRLPDVQTEMRAVAYA